MKNGWLYLTNYGIYSYCHIFELVYLVVCSFLAGNMANVCEHFKRSMSSHDNHASCPQCRMAAGQCSLDMENLCTTCVEWTRRQWGKLRRSLVDARARSKRGGDSTGRQPSLVSKRGFCQSQYLPQPQKSLPRLVKAIMRKIYWSARQTSKLSRVW